MVVRISHRMLEVETSGDQPDEQRPAQDPSPDPEDLIEAINYRTSECYGLSQPQALNCVGLGTVLLFDGWSCDTRSSPRESRRPVSDR